MTTSRMHQRTGARALFLLALAIAVSVASSSARSQPPPHQPGTVCQTSAGWCKMPYVAYVGTACGCPVNGKIVSGVVV
jgi:hypothetical protein